MRVNKTIKNSIVIVIAFCILTIGLSICKCIFLNTCENGKNHKVTYFMSAIEFYYGEWEITEDFGYNGIHRTIEKDIYKVGETVLFSRECFKNESSIKITYPRITFEPITPASMVGVYKMTNPEKMGFIWDEQYIRAMVWDDNNGTPIAHTFYILNDDVIIFEGDIHRYYKAIRK